jgi:hypothetical protein
MQQRAKILTTLPVRGSASLLIAELDGTLVPLVETGRGTDRRKQRVVSWSEARLCLVRPPASITPRFAATLGKVEEVGKRLTDCVIRVGGGGRTRLHCVGDGAPWIREQIERHFFGQASYLIDFWHVSQYLAAASEQILPRQAKAWLHQQQERLKQNRLSTVLRSLRPHLEAEQVAEEQAPVRVCFRYLANRIGQLDYRSALQAGLPIGSGEVESAHRYVIQARLKIAGAWWKRENAEKMLALRVARANDEWQSYWGQERQAAA